MVNYAQTDAVGLLILMSINRRPQAMKVQRRFKNMNIFKITTGISWPRWDKVISLPILTLALLLVIWPQNLSAYQDAQAQPQAPPPTGQAPPYTQGTPEQLQQLVAPIALYPDSLVAQILAASTFPEQVVEAERWVQEHPDLKGEALGQAVDPQPWDPSVKALTAFPAVLGNMDKNLAWTSSLGDAYYNQQQDVMDAIQVMRQRAQGAGNLKTTPQQTVTTQGSTIIVQPADPEVVYVPAYNPWMVYGGPIMAWPGWYPYPGIWFGGPYLSFGMGFGIGYFGGFGWGWNHWGFNWGGRYATFGGGRYYSRSNTFYNRSSYYRGGGARGGAYRSNSFTRGGGERGGVSGRPGATARAFNGNRQAARGYAAPRGQTGTRTGAFSHIEKGGQTKSYSSRGSASVSHGTARGGGGGAPHGGGGGGGGSHGGGGGHH
jgi:uncharacterized membrane protein YgcG